WGKGVTSSIPLIFSPAFCRFRIACSRPEPGPLTFTSISSIPCLRASEAAFSAARPAANGVLLRAPLKPTVPADAQEIVSPLVSVMVIMVLLKVALMWATPRVTPLRTFFFGPPGFAGLAAPVVGVVGADSAIVDPEGATPASPSAPLQRRRWRRPYITCSIPSRPSYRRRSSAGPCGYARSIACAVRAPARRGDDDGLDCCRYRAVALMPV